MARISEYVVYSPGRSPPASGTDHRSPPTARDPLMPPVPAARGAPSAAHTATSTAAGSSRAVSFNQYWKACTKVIERIPPEETLSRTTEPTTTGPTQVGAPTAAARVSPAPWNCGSR